MQRFSDRAKAVRDNLELLGDPTLVQLYYERLMEVGRAYQGQKGVSIAQFTQPVFRLAYERSAGLDVRDENRAAILALAMYLGDTRLRSS